MRTIMTKMRCGEKDDDDDDDDDDDVDNGEDD